MTKVKLPDPDWVGAAGQPDYGNPSWQVGDDQFVSANAYGITVVGEELYADQIDTAERVALAVIAAAHAHREMSRRL